MSINSTPTSSSMSQLVISPRRDLATDIESRSSKLLQEAYELLDDLKGYEDDHSKFVNDSYQILKRLTIKIHSINTPYCLIDQKIQYLKRLAKRNQENYAPAFIKVLLEQTTDQKLYPISPKMHNLIHYAIKHQNIHALEELHRNHPHLLKSYVQSGKKSPLILALSMPNRSEFARLLINSGADINFCQDPYQPPLLTVLFHYTEDYFESLLLVLSQPTLNANVNNSEGRNALHLLAFLTEHEKALELMIGDPRFIDLFHQKDVYGYLPVDYAYFFKNERLIQWIEGSTAVDRTDPRYGLKPINICQRVHISKMVQFIKISVQDGEEPQKDLIASISKGCCYGFSFLFLYYHAKGKPELFYEILETISSWDGKLASLSMPFESSRLAGLYLNYEDFFQQTINDVVWFQNVYISLTDEHKQIFIKRRTREIRYSITKNSEKDPAFKKVVDTYKVWVNKEQLAEILDLFAFRPNLMVDLNGATHSVGIISLPNGKKRFYDPNQKFRIEDFHDTAQLVQLIETFKFKRMNKLESDGSMPVDIQVFQVDSCPVTPLELEEIVPFLNRVSPNRFTPLHLAVIFNNRRLFDQVMNQEGVDVNCKDIHGYTPIDYATLMNRSELFIELLQVSKIGGYMPFLHFAFEYREEEMIRAYMQHPMCCLVEILDKCVEYRILHLAELTFQTSKTTNNMLSTNSICIRKILNNSIGNIPISKLLLMNGVWPTKKFYQWLKDLFEKSSDLVEDLLRSMPNIDAIDGEFEGENLCNMAKNDNHHELIALLHRLGSKGPIERQCSWL